MDSEPNLTPADLQAIREIVREETVQLKEDVAVLKETAERTEEAVSKIVLHHGLVLAPEVQRRQRLKD